MILLDTNYLIRVLVEGTLEADHVRNWITAGEDLCTSSIAWYELLCGPVDEAGVELVGAIVNYRIIPYTTDHAMESARFFNSTGRKRRLRVDSMVVAAAIVRNAQLETDKVQDFGEFLPQSLKMV